MVRLRDIAQRLGLSVMSVSRALRDSPDIAAATRARVRAAAHELGYVPNITARGLRTRSTTLLGVVVPSLLDPVFARLIAGLEERAREVGYELLTAQSQNLADREDACLRSFLARRVDGVFVWPAARLAPEAQSYEELRQRGQKLVVLGPVHPFCAGFLSVSSHDLPASLKATEHLLSLGHREIVHLRGPALSPSSRDRFEGYRRALRQAGLEVDDRLVFNAGNTIENGHTAALQMLHEGVRPSAIFAANDAVAIGAMEALLLQGLKIPQRVSVVGFGNIPLAGYCQVPLTTVRQPKRALGAAAMDLMLRLLRGEPVISALLPAELVIRASSGPPSTDA